MGSHTLSDLRLGKTGILAGFQQSIKQQTFFALDAFNFSSHAGTTQQLLYQSIMRLHV